MTPCDFIGRAITLSHPPSMTAPKPFHRASRTIFYNKQICSCLYNHPIHAFSMPAPIQSSKKCRNFATEKNDTTKPCVQAHFS